MNQDEEEPHKRRTESLQESAKGDRLATPHTRGLTVASRGNDEVDHEGGM